MPSHGFLISLSLFFGITLNAIQAHSNEVNQALIDFEHSIHFNNGAGWGTEDSLRDLVRLPETEVPEIYRQPNAANAPLFVQDLGSSSGALFEDGEMVFFKNLEICIDQTLPRPDADLKEAFQFYAQMVMGIKDPNYIHLKSIDIENDDIRNCSVMIRRGSWSTFPFDRLRRQHQRYLNDWKNQVYGVFYRVNKNTIPVVDIHPDVDVSYSKSQNSYLSNRESSITIDGRALYLHEVGHAIGFAHLGPAEATSMVPGSSLMGMTNSSRLASDLALRFKLTDRLWERFDLKQSMLYRIALARYLSGVIVEGNTYSRPSDLSHICLQKGDRFDLAIGPIRARGPQTEILKSSSLLIDVEEGQNRLQSMAARMVPFLKYNRLGAADGYSVRLEQANLLMNTEFPINHVRLHSVNLLRVKDMVYFLTKFEVLDSSSSVSPFKVSILVNEQEIYSRDNLPMFQLSEKVQDCRNFDIQSRGWIRPVQQFIHIPAW